MNAGRSSPAVDVLLVDPDAFTQYYDLNLAAALKQQCWSVEVVTSRHQFEAVPTPEGIALSEPFFHRLKQNRLPRPLRRGLKAIAYPAGLVRLDRRMGRLPAAIVHVQWALLPPLDELFWCRWQRRGWSIVFTAHDIAGLPGTTPAFLAAVGARLVARADAVIVHSAWERKRVEAAGVPERRVSVVPQGGPGLFLGDRPNREQARCRLGLDAEGPLLLFFGLVKPYKGLDVLLRAMPRVARAAPEVQLLIAGEPLLSCRHERDLIRTLGIERRVVWKPGFVPVERVASVFAAADVVVLPYRQASSSAVLVMAYAHGRPVVATAVGPLTEMVEHRSSGLLVPPDDPEQLADALIEMLADRAACEQMGGRAESLHVARHDWAEIARRTGDVYRSVRYGGVSNPLSPRHRWRSEKSPHPAIG